jgi:hypothetical protein
VPGIGVDASGLLKKLRGASANLRSRVDAAVRDVARETRERISHDYWRQRTGYTSSKTQVEKLGHAHYRVALRVPWAVVLDKGSRPHIIRPKKAKVLGPTAGGRFFKSAKHPGTKGFGFARKEADRAKVLLAVRVEDAIRGAFKLTRHALQTRRDDLPAFAARRRQEPPRAG